MSNFTTPKNTYAYFDFPSPIIASASLDNTGTTDLAIGAVVLPASPLPAGTSIKRVVLLVKYRKIADSSGSNNAINIATGNNVKVQKAAGTLATALNLPDNSLACLASGEGSGDVIVGTTDIKSTVDEWSATYNVQITDTKVDGNNLILYDVQCIIRVFYG